MQDCPSSIDRSQNDLFSVAASPQGLCAFVPLWELACKRWAADLHRPLRQQAGSHKKKGSLALYRKAFDPFVGACLQAMGCGPAQAASPAGWLLQKERLFGALPQGLCGSLPASDGLRTCTGCFASRLAPTKRKALWRFASPAGSLVHRQFRLATDACRLESNRWLMAR